MYAAIYCIIALPVYCNVASYVAALAIYVATYIYFNNNLLGIQIIQHLMLV